MRDSSSIKPSAGVCFAAGEGFQRGLGLLSDAAFKLFAHLCLQAELARRLGKSRSTLGRCLQELVRQGVCRIEPAPTQHQRSRLHI